MDVLSDAVRVMRTGTPRAALTTRHAAWRQRLQPAPGSLVFEAVLAGSCLLVTPRGDTSRLDTGDVLFLVRGGEYELREYQRRALTGPPPTGQPGHAAPQPGADSTEAGSRTVTLSGAYRLDADRGHPLLDELPDVLRLPARPGSHPRLRNTVDLLAAELEAPAPGTNAVVSSLLDTLFVHVLRAWLAEQPACGGPTGWGAALADPAVRAALDAIHDDPAHPWKVGTLAAHARVSRAVFARRFTTTVGRSPLAYVTWWRLTLAARLLRGSDAPLNAVAARVGYRSPYAFANAFAREFGVAPGRYRRGARPPDV